MATFSETVSKIYDERVSERPLGTQRSAAFEGTGAASMQLDAGQTEQYVMEKDESLPNVGRKPFSKVF